MKNFLLAILASMLVALTPTVATAAPEFPPEEGWTMAAYNDDGAYYIRDADWHVGRSHHTSLKIWAWLAPAPSRGTTKELTLFEINCRRSSFRILQFTKFTRDNKNQTVTHSSEWAYAVPGSIIAEIVDMGCADPN